MKYKVGQMVQTKGTFTQNQDRVGTIKDTYHDDSYLIELGDEQVWLHEGEFEAINPEIKAVNIYDLPKEWASNNCDVKVDYASTTTNTPPTISQLQKEVHQLSKEKGWYDPPKTDLECMALIHSEISEAVEELRSKNENPHLYQVGYDYDADGKNNYMTTPGEDWDPSLKPCGLASELADAVIRILDYCEWKGINLEEAIKLKHEFNKTRAYRHGKKL